MTKALPPHTPPNNVRPIHGAIAIIGKASPETDAMFEKIRAQAAFIQTCAALQCRIDRLESAKKLRMKELANELKLTHDDLGQYLTGKPFEQVAGAIQAVLEALNAGEQPLAEDIKEIVAHVPGSRDRWIARDKAESFKAAESKRMQAKIDEVSFALAKLCRYGLEGKRDQAAEQAQADLPGVEKPAPQPKTWIEPKVQRTIYDTVAEEVTRSDETIRSAKAAGDTKAADEAAKSRAAYKDLQDQLLLSGFMVEEEGDEAGEDDDAEQVDLQLDDEEATDGDGIPPDAIDIGDATPVETKPMDPADHPALKGALADGAAKRAKNKAAKPLVPPTNHP